MARIRSIHPGFKGDAKVRRLSRDARLTFLLMLPEADDEGRLLGSPKSLAGTLFPNDEDVSSKVVMRWVDELTRQGMVAPYCVDGIEYIAIPKFKVYQKPKNPTPSKIPPPPPAGGVATPGTSPPSTPPATPGASGAASETSAPLELGGRRLELGGGPPEEPATPKPDPANALLRAFWDDTDPKPAQPWPAMLGVVRKMLAAGWSETDVAWALRDAPTVSTAALTLSLNRRDKPNGTGPAAASAKAMLAYVASQDER